MIIYLTQGLSQKVVRVNTERISIITKTDSGSLITFHSLSVFFNETEDEINELIAKAERNEEMLKNQLSLDL